MTPTTHPVTYVLDLIGQLVPASRTLDAVRELMPFIANLLTSETTLTDERRASIQRQVLLGLRRIGIEGQDIG